MTEFITVAKVGDIPDQEGRAFRIGDAKVAVFNDGGTFRAIDDMCPHAGASLADGFYDDQVVTCPWHAWSFRTTDGAFCGHPRLKIDVYAVRVINDEIQVSVRPVRPVDSADSDPNESSSSATDANHD